MATAKKSAALPTEVRLRSYQVGFGDCFLLTLTYADGARHVLFDFGSTAKPKDASKTLLADVASDIAEACNQGADPLIVVASHRHQDHIGGFDPGANDDGPGATIRGLAPKLVLQPWTEDPELEEDATGPARPSRARVRTLGAAQRLVNMQRVGALAARETAAAARAGDRTAARIHFMGSDAIKNRGAVENLMTMADNEYLHFDKPTALGRHLPGVKVHVLGPPTLEQTDTIRTQRQRDDDEFWKVLGLGSGGAATPAHEEPSLESPFASRRLKTIPPAARWFVRKTQRVRRSQLLQIVRALDDAMNNTSLILLLEIGSLKLLFPGDAQIENWEYALKSPEHAARVRALLEDVRLYKVGHHGSRNATPLTLWEMFKRRSPNADAPGRLASVMSTMAGKHHGVPVQSLVDDLKRDTDHFSTGSMKRLYRDLVWTRRGASWVLG